VCHAHGSYFESQRADGVSSRFPSSHLMLTNCLAMSCNYAGISVGCVLAHVFVVALLSHLQIHMNVFFLFFLT
jgi:hypothetical protein